MWNTLEKKLKEKNISIYRLSKVTGIGESTIRHYKNGTEPSFKNMCKIADALDVSLDYFREGERK